MKILTAVQPTNNITIGNYLGSIKEMVNFQNEGHEVMIFIADLHSITVDYKPEDLNKNIMNTLATYIACGIDPKKTTIFLQSAINEHSQLKHLLSPFVSYGDLTRMHQFKDKQESQKYISLALLDYPVLMAADILLYKPDIIPVGQDQIQHIELMSSIAQRFNQKHEYFKTPKAHISSFAKVMSLQNPNKKMSKSDPNQMGTIFLNDSKELIEKKMKRSVTDSLSTIEYSSDPARLGLKNLLDLYSVFSNKSVKETLTYFESKQYGHLKEETSDVINIHLMPIREKIKSLLDHPGELMTILKDGNNIAKLEAHKNLKEIMKIMGFDLYE